MSQWNIDLFQNKFKVVALKVTSNINGLIKDLFHNPPSYKCIVNLSWKPIVSIVIDLHTVFGIITANTPISAQ